jgi:hypothetical protein
VKRTIFRIVTHKHGGWAVLGDYGRRWATQDAAVAYYAMQCRRILEAGGRAQLVLHGRDGRIRWERTYAADPRRSKG